MINLLNFDERGRTKPYIDSPRSLEACLRQGITPEELIIQPLQKMKQIYKDGMNDKNSLKIKLQHHEHRRKQKLNLAIQERQKLINQPLKVHNKCADTFSRTRIRQVDDKLEKKKIMDEVKQELKRKNLQIKDIQLQRRLDNLEKRKKEQIIYKKNSNIHKNHRKEHNIVSNQVKKIQKVNTLLNHHQLKEQQIQQMQREKQKHYQNRRKQKQEYYEYKNGAAQQIQSKKQTQKQQKVKAKEQNYQKYQTDVSFKNTEYRKFKEAETRKNQQWKQINKKNAELQARKKQQRIHENIMNKQFQKEEVLSELNQHREAVKQANKIDKQQKFTLIKNKQQEDQFQQQKKRRIIEIKEQMLKEQQQKKARDKKSEQNHKMQSVREREEERKRRLEDDEEEKKMQAQFILDRQQQKQQIIQEKVKDKRQKQNQKFLMKKLKDQQIFENQKRQEIIKGYEKNKMLDNYNEKMKRIEEEKSIKKIQTKVYPPNRQQIQQKIKSQENINSRIKSKENIDENKKFTTIKETEDKKKNNKEREKEKERLKKQQIRKLIQNVKIQYNREEFVLMQEEEMVEKERQELEKTSQNIAQLKRLQKIHGVQRARFHEKLNSFMKQNLQKVKQYQKKLDHDLILA